MFGIIYLREYNYITTKDTGMGESDYLQKQKEEFIEYEARCRRCGACCGANDGDPCVHLEKRDDAKYYCNIYDNRIGMQRTLAGKQFACVPLRDLRPNLPFKDCVYFK